jgi:hypothetical protein
MQRCYRETHLQHQDYKGRGITVEFQSREHFIRWALAEYPDTDFKGMEFDRKDNDGPYSPDNLQLVSSQKNKLNKRYNSKMLFQGKQICTLDFPSPYSIHVTYKLAMLGLSGEQMIQRAVTSVQGKCRNWQGLASRLEELGYMTCSTPGNDTASPATVA